MLADVLDFVGAMVFPAFDALGLIECRLENQAAFVLVWVGQLDTHGCEGNPAYGYWIRKQINGVA